MAPPQVPIQPGLQKCEIQNYKIWKYETQALKYANLKYGATTSANTTGVAKM